MPHINQATKDRIIRDNLRVQFQDDKGNMTGYGELCFTFALVYLNLYNANPKWETVHRIRVVSKSPFSCIETNNIVMQNASMFQREDVVVAADLAFLEFYRVVGSVHEDVKMQENGSAFEGANTPKFNRGNKTEVKGYLNVG